MTTTHADSKEDVLADARPRIDPLLSDVEAAGILGCKPQTLAVWRTTHRYPLPFVKVGRLVRYRTSDLQAFLTRNTVNPMCAAQV